MLAYSHVLMNSCSRARQLSCPLAIVPPGSRVGKVWSRVGILLSLGSRLVCSDSLQALSSIPRESIRSLSNSLPVLARTGFENRAPTGAKRSFLRSKGFPEPRTSPRAPDELPMPLQESPKRLEELSKRLQEDPKDAPRAPKGAS